MHQRAAGPAPKAGGNDPSEDPGPPSVVIANTPFPLAAKSTGPK